MKKLPLTLFCLIILLVSTHSIQAQNDSTNVRKNIISTHVLLIITLNPNLYYERLITPKSSINLGFSYANFNRLIAGSAVGSEYITASLGYRYYFQKSNIAPEGFYLFPRIRLYNLLLKSDTDFSTSALEVGMATGYQWIFNSNFTLDLHLGIQAAILQKGFEEESKEDLSGISPFLGIRLGYNF